MSREEIERIPFLRGAYEGLTKSERQIAAYIAQRPRRIMKETIPGIAAATGSSEITVSRFAKAGISRVARVETGFDGLSHCQ